MGAIFGIPLLDSGINVQVTTLGLLRTSILEPLRRRSVLDDPAVKLPILFIMQLEDELFPRDGYLELFDLLGSDDKRLHANPGLHPEVPPDEMAFAIDFMAERLSAPVPQEVWAS